MRAICIAVSAIALAAVAFGQAVPTCNGLPATIVATTPGVINGTNGDDVIVGTSGNDIINGLAGNDTICGGGGNDTITGGQGNDTLFGEAGDDTFVWNPGDGSDRIEGSTETDTLVVNGANISEVVGLSANGARLRFTRDIASIVLDAGGIERVVFNARGGSDSITVASLVGTGVQQVTLELESVPGSKTPDGAADSVFVFGTTGNDSISLKGSAGVVDIAGAGPAIQILHPDPTLDTLTVSGDAGADRIDASALVAGVMNLIIDGGQGNDTIRGSSGADTLTGGEGDDTFEWLLGTAADAITGDIGSDTLVVIGTTAADRVMVAAAALDAQVFNFADGTTMTVAVEKIVVQAKGGADQVTVATAAASTLERVTVDLRPTPTSTTGDSATDTITVNGTSNADTFTITGSLGSATVSGMAPTVVIEGAESARDLLLLNGGAGDDVINATALAADAIKLSLRGGQGFDTVTGGAGDDTFVWSPGDGSDTIDGGAGNDLLQIFGANIAENIAFSANGTRLRFTRDIASIVLDAAEVERVSFAALGGADTISFTDLSSTPVRQVALDLSGSAGGGDTSQDTIAVAAPAGQAITTSVNAAGWTLSWGPVRISVTGVEPGLDRVILQSTPGAAPIVAAADGTETAAVRGALR